MGVQEEEFRQAMERLEREVLAMKSYLEQIIATSKNSSIWRGNPGLSQRLKAGTGTRCPATA
jgi:hypothetical protein